LLALGILVGLATGIGVWLFRLAIDLSHKIFAEFADPARQHPNKKG